MAHRVSELAPDDPRLAQRLRDFADIAFHFSPLEGAADPPEHHRALRPAERIVPDMRGRPATVAQHVLHAHGFDPAPQSRTARGFVAAQEPDPYTTAGPGEAIRLATYEPEDSGAQPQTTPDVTGLPAREALHTLALYGVRARVEGSGLVVRQVPAAGTAATAEAVLICQ